MLMGSIADCFSVFNDQELRAFMTDFKIFGNFAGKWPVGQQIQVIQFRLLIQCIDLLLEVFKNGAADEAAGGMLEDADFMLKRFFYRFCEVLFIFYGFPDRMLVLVLFFSAKYFIKKSSYVKLF